MAKTKAKSNEEFIASLKTNPAYSHLDIDFEVAKATTWCEVNNRQNTQRFFVNWINRIQRPLTTGRRFDPGRAAASDSVETDPKCGVCGKMYCLDLHRD